MAGDWRGGRETSDSPRADRTGIRAASTDAILRVDAGSVVAGWSPSAGLYGYGR
jgi:hypothetical protein